MCAHTLIAGGLGSGKSHFVRVLLAALSGLAPHIPVMLFDPNHTYRGFCSDPSTWLSVDWDAIALNPLAEPAGYSRRRWLNEAIDVLTRNELMHSKHLLAMLLDRLCEDAERRAAGTGRYLPPTLFDVHRALHHLRRRAANLGHQKSPERAKGSDFTAGQRLQAKQVKRFVQWNATVQQP